LLVFRFTNPETTMTTLARIFPPIVLALAVAAGCTGGGTVVPRDDVRDGAPPAERAERAEYRPGYIYVQGHWQRDRQRWAWMPGYYERARPGYVYIEGRWSNDRDGHHWIDGEWRRREGVSIRERRRY